MLKYASMHVTALDNLPHRLVRAEDGSWTFYNRKNKPIGYPVALAPTTEEFEILTGLEETDDITLYDAHNPPDQETDEFRHYCRRLQIILSMDMQEPPAAPPLTVEEVHTEIERANVVISVPSWVWAALAITALAASISITLISLDTVSFNYTSSGNEASAAIQAADAGTATGSLDIDLAKLSNEGKAPGPGDTNRSAQACTAPKPIYDIPQTLRTCACPSNSEWDSWECSKSNKAGEIVCKAQHRYRLGKDRPYLQWIGPGGKSLCW